MGDMFLATVEGAENVGAMLAATRLGIDATIAIDGMELDDDGTGPKAIVRFLVIASSFKWSDVKITTGPPCRVVAGEVEPESQAMIRRLCSALAVAIDAIKREPASAAFYAERVADLEERMREGEAFIGEVG